MSLTEENIAAECADRSVFGSGVNSFRSGNVTDFDQYPSPKYHQLILSASVKGGGVYYNVEVALEEETEAISYYDCDCAGFSRQKGACAHVAAVLLRYLEDRGPVEPSQQSLPSIQTDYYTAALLQRGRAQMQEQEEKGSAGFRLRSFSYSAAPGAWGSAGTGAQRWQGETVYHSGYREVLRSV